MPNILRKGDMSVGKDGGNPTALTFKNQATKTYWGGQLIALVGDQFQPHRVGLVTHSASQREIIAGSSTMFFEGKAVSRTGDPIADGDECGPGLGSGFAG